MSRAVSIQDIARVAGVSHTTVSRALRDSPLISAEVRQHIQQLALSMGYTPNAVAQSLKGKRTNTIGLIVTTIADPFVGRVVRGIEDAAQAARMSVVLSASYNNAERELAVIESFHRRRVDGVIFAASKAGPQYMDRLARINVPTVLVNHQAEAEFEMLHSVEIDDFQGASLAVTHLLSLGHSAIGYLGAGNRPRSNRRRLEGYLNALSQAGIHSHEEWIRIASPDHRYHSDDVADGKALLLPLYQSGVTAIFCYNDMVAVGTLLACRELGIAVPDQLSIVGYDDIELAQYVTPPLTTIHQPKLRLGQIAMEMLLDLLADKPVSNQILPVELVARGSTGPKPGSYLPPAPPAT